MVVPSSLTKHFPQSQLCSKAAGAFGALVVLQVTLALSYKFAQTGPSAQYPFSSPALLVVAESTKFFISLCLFFHSQWPIGSDRSVECQGHKQSPSRSHHILSQFRSEVSLPLLRNTALLAVLYAINNNIAFAVFRIADGANINLIKSGSSFLSALLLRFALARPISRVQWSAIFLQMFGLVVAQFGSTCSNTPVLLPHAYLLLFVSLLISTICGVWNDQMLKSSGDASMHTINMLLYAFGFLMNGLTYVYFPDPEKHFFSGFDAYPTHIVLLFQSLSGVTISAVYKFSDVTTKTFALSCATSILLFINVVAFHSAFSLVATTGCLIVYVATHLYVSNPSLQPANSAVVPATVELLSNCRYLPVRQHSPVNNDE
jgi:hypothetical protein